MVGVQMMLRDRLLEALSRQLGRFTLRPVSDIIEHLHQAGLDLLEDRRVGHGADPFHVFVCERTSNRGTAR